MLLLLRFFTFFTFFFKIQKNVTFYVFCFASYVFSNYVHDRRQLVLNTLGDFQPLVFSTQLAVISAVHFFAAVCG